MLWICSTEAERIRKKSDNDFDMNVQELCSVQ